MGLIIDGADPADFVAIGEWGTHRAIVDQMQQSGGLAGMVTGRDPARAVYDRLTARMAEVEPNGEHAAVVAAARDALVAETYRHDPEGTSSMQVELMRANVSSAEPVNVLAEFQHAAEERRITQYERDAREHTREDQP